MDERVTEFCFREWKALAKRLQFHDQHDMGFRFLRFAYSEPHRKYHDLGHIAHCLALLKTVSSQLVDADAAALALWFHDAVYVPGRTDNEKHSAAVLLCIARASRINERVAALAAKHVRATSAHHSSGHPDTAFVIDIDLSPLGAHSSRFDRDEVAIREEYEAYLDSMFWPARRAVLAQFLAREPLYMTQPIRDRYELRAKENLRRSIARIDARV